MSNSPKTTMFASQKSEKPVPDQRLSRKSASADKCVTSSNLSASGQHGISAPIKPVARPGRRTGKPGGDAEGGPVPFPSAPLSEVEEFHWDPILPGFGIRSQKSGKRVYFVQYRERGRTRRRVIGEVDVVDVRMARRRARKILSNVKVGLGVVDPFNLPVASPPPTFAGYVPQFWHLHAHRWAPNTQKLNLGAVERLLIPAFGPMPVADITREMVMKWRDGMGDRQGMANRTLPVLSVMMKTAETMGLRPRNSNPCRNMRRFERKALDRFLSLDEIERLGFVLRRFDAVYPHVSAIIRLLLLTGARKREIETLTWEMIDGKFLHLSESKTGPKTIYLSSAAQDYITALPQESDIWLFPAANGNRPIVIDYQQWKRIRKAAGLPDVRLHDLRHTFASHAVMNKVTLPTLSKLLGHALLETSERYAHLSDDSVKDAIGRVSGHLARVTGFAQTGAGL